jgi:hypothetical protein
MLHRAWTAAGLIGAPPILAMCTDSVGNRSRRLLAQRPLAAAVKAMRATPALRGAPSAVNPAGSPDDRLAEPAAAVVCDAVIACCDALQQMISLVPSDVRPPSAARACAVVAESAQAISGIYRAPTAPEPARRAACQPAGIPPGWHPSRASGRHR